LTTTAFCKILATENCYIGGGTALKVRHHGMKEALFGRLDRIIFLLENAGRPSSVLSRVLSGLATGAGILGVLSAADVIRTWVGG